MKPERYRIIVTGIVQGVGFRPFIHNLANSLFLKGWVNNTSEGVVIEAEGTGASLETFLSSIKKHAPQMSYIKDIFVEHLEYIGYNDFIIKASSKKNTVMNTYISPDMSVCDDCKRELFDKADYRYLYPFINCTNCGPRFTIIHDVPYDRPNTTMCNFPMCEICKTQYSEPADRRYHAQPISCHNCGPQLSLLDNEGSRMECGNFALQAANLLAGNFILAIKGLGGYHLACDAYNGNTVARLRKRKVRDEKPFALMARDIDTVMKHCHVDEMEKKLLQSARKPVVLLKKRSDCLLPDEIAPGNPYLGFMLPYTPVHLLLFECFSSGLMNRNCPDVLVMTSGNRSNEPICFKDAAALEELHDIADYFLVNDREIHIRTDDSVVRVFRGREYMIRRARGYVPMPVILEAPLVPQNSCSILACGGELKNTFCLSKKNEFYLSHHIGDMENMETMQSFEDGIDHFKKLFDIKPDIIAYDLHPEYLSTKYALSNEIAYKIPIQHHHAHIASCMAENGLSGDVIGVAFDGAGYGEDGNIWGGEFFTGSYKSFKRAGHLEYVKMPGGEAAIREPWRMAASYLVKAGIELPDTEYHNQTGCINSLFHDIEASKISTIKKMLDISLNCPLTSSMGRLFDAVSALSGIRSNVSFEGQAAIELEYAAINGYYGEYAFEIEKKEDIFSINVTGIIKGIIEDMNHNVPVGEVSSKFHETAAAIVYEACCLIRLDTGLNRVALSGGVFQNILLLSKCLDKLEKSEFEVYLHSKIPTNDGGISLGQAVIAMAKCN